MLLEKIQKLSKKEMVEFFMQSCENVSEVQSLVLKEILTLNKDTEFAKQFGFSDISSYEEFKKNIPITTWQDYKEYSNRMQNGEKDLIFAGAVEYFTQTSGTTGKMKLLPESRYGKMAKQLVTAIRTSILFSKYPDILKGKYLPMINGATMGYTKAHIPYGSASGLSVKNLSPQLLNYMAFPKEIAEVSDIQTADYLTMRFAIEHDVRLIIGNNAGRIESLILHAKRYQNLIISDIRDGTINKKFVIDKNLMELLKPYLKPNPKRADELLKRTKTSKEFLPSLYWSNLEVISCWLGGSVGRYTKKILKYFTGYEKGIEFFDVGYGASEVKVNIPIKSDTSSGIVASFGAFYEFLPLGSDDKEDVLLLNQLELDKEYRLIITTYSGLYRYDMKDIVKVDGFIGDTPTISFISKSGDIGNICGEKVTASLISDVVDRFFDIDVKYFCAIADKDEFRYVLCVEPESRFDISQDELKNLAKDIEEYMFVLNDPYKVFREQNLLNKLEIKIMPKGWYDELIQHKLKTKAAANQIKLPVIYESYPIGVKE